MHLAIALICKKIANSSAVAVEFCSCKVVLVVVQESQMMVCDVEANSFWLACQDPFFF